MKCTECQDLLDDYIRGMLKKSQAVTITEHLAACPDCSKQYQALKSMLSFLKLETEPEIKPATLGDFLPGVWEKIEKDKSVPLKDRLLKWVMPLTAALALTLLIFGWQAQPNIQKTADANLKAIDNVSLDTNIYDSLLGWVFADQDTTTLKIISQELFSNAGEVYNYDFSAGLDDLSDDELKIMENNLNKLFNDAG